MLLVFNTNLYIVIYFITKAEVMFICDLDLIISCNYLKLMILKGELNVN